MKSLRTRLEPVFARVLKLTRRIACEGGVHQPGHADCIQSPTLMAVTADGPTGLGTLLPAEPVAHPRGLRPAEGQGCRTHHWIEHDGARREPVSWTTSLNPAITLAGYESPVMATSAPHACERAS